MVGGPIESSKRSSPPQSDLAPCMNGLCNDDPCEGVICNQPPPSTCANATTLTVYAASGVCSAGFCSYPASSVACTCQNNACESNPCAGVICNSPPSATCVGNVLRTFASPGTCDGTTGGCAYASTDTTCSAGCQNAQCANDRCVGVVCNQPPAQSCVNATTLRTYASSGTCDPSTGACTYSSSQSSCSGTQTCQGGACVAIACSLAFSPTALDWGTVNPQTATTQSVTVSNTGQGDCSLTNVALSSSTDPDFSLSSLPAMPIAVAPGTIFSIDVVFNAPNANAPATHNGDLLLTTTDANHMSVDVPLSAQVSLCGNVTCNQPPAASCVNATTTLSYGSTGTCNPSTGSCSYTATSQTCSGGMGCYAGACTPWLEVDTGGPSARSAHGMVFDSARGRTVMFGGTDGSNELGDTWEWDGTNWWPVSSSGAYAREWHAIAYDSWRGQSVVFGGYGSGYLYGDTWAWNGSAWTELSATGPSGRESHAMAFDSARGQIVLFGGGNVVNNAANILGDTWEWNGSTWTQVASTGPSPREGHAMAFDSARGKTVLFGGANGNEYGDTWEWDGSTWALVSTTGPAARLWHGMAYDSARRRTVLFGGQNSSTFGLGDTWEWDGTNWTQIANVGPERSGPGLAFDSAHSQTVMFGGLMGNFLNDTWLY
jgi:hypothetical protein